LVKCSLSAHTQIFFNWYLHKFTLIPSYQKLFLQLIRVQIYLGPPYPKNLSINICKNFPFGSSLCHKTSNFFLPKIFPWSLLIAKFHSIHTCIKFPNFKNFQRFQQPPANSAQKVCPSHFQLTLVCWKDAKSGDFETSPAYYDIFCSSSRRCLFTRGHFLQLLSLISCWNFSVVCFLLPALWGLVEPTFYGLRNPFLMTFELVLVLVFRVWLGFVIVVDFWVLFVDIWSCGITGSWKIDCFWFRNNFQSCAIVFE
jgi:hypothetical protein